MLQVFAEFYICYFWILLLHIGGINPFSVFLILKLSTIFSQWNMVDTKILFLNDSLFNSCDIFRYLCLGSVAAVHKKK